MHYLTKGLSSNYQNARWSSESDTGDLIKCRYGGKKVVENETQPETKDTVSILYLPNPIRRSEALFKMIHSTNACVELACTQAQLLSRSFSPPSSSPCPTEKSCILNNIKNVAWRQIFSEHIKSNQTDLKKV